MTHYLFPKNLKAKATIWLWRLRDFAILGISALLSVVILVYLGWLMPAALTLCFGFLTVQLDETTMLDYISYAIRYFITSQQYFEWR